MSLGFWSNKNGQAILASHDSTLSTQTGTWRTALNALNLRDAKGNPFDVSLTASFSTAYATFRTWLLGATATNMAYMLSAQLVTMKFNTLYMGLDPNTMLQVPASLLSNLNTKGPAPVTNLLGFVSIADLMAKADAILGTNGYTVSAGNIRLYQEALKSLLDAANNNKPIFVHPTPCTVIYT